MIDPEIERLAAENQGTSVEKIVNLTKCFRDEKARPWSDLRQAVQKLGFPVEDCVVTHAHDCSGSSIYYAIHTFDGEFIGLHFFVDASAGNAIADLEVYSTLPEEQEDHRQLLRISHHLRERNLI